MAPTLLTTAQVAEQFQVEPTTVTAWVRKGILHGLRVPGSKGYRFHPDDVERLVAEMRNGDRAAS